MSTTQGKRNKIFKSTLFYAVLSFAMGAGLLYFFIAADITAKSSYVNSAIDLVGIVVVLILLVNCALFDSSDEKSKNNFYELLLFVLVVTFYSDGIGWIFDGKMRFAGVCKVFDFINLIAWGLMPFIFLLYLINFFGIEFKKVKLFKVITSIYFALTMLYCISNFFTGFIYTYDEDAVFVTKPGTLVYYVLVTLVLSMSVYIIFKADFSKFTKVVLILFVILPVLSFPLSYLYPSVSYYNLFALIAIMLLHTNIINITVLDLAEQKALVVKQKNQLMSSQIQPHFIYNALGTIYELCDTDAEKAKKTVGNFSRYLRVILDNKEELIPFEKEISNTENYTFIEMQRFENFQVFYDIQDTNFKIPFLSIQPIVENAIRHGIRTRKHGVINIVSKQVDGFHVISVEDSGIGYDVNTATVQTNREHIGITNVRSRLETMCNGTLTIFSEHDKGTIVTIKIPVTEEENEIEPQKIGGGTDK